MTLLNGTLNYYQTHPRVFAVFFSLCLGRWRPSAIQVGFGKAGQSLHTLGKVQRSIRMVVSHRYK